MRSRARRSRCLAARTGRIAVRKRGASWDGRRARSTRASRIRWRGTGRRRDPVLGFSFRELMEGKVRMGETDRRMRFDFKVRGPTMFLLLIHWLGTMTGAVTIDGFVADSPA